MGRLSISIPDDMEKRVTVFLSRSKEYDSVSEFYQKLTMEFLEPGSKHYLSLFMLYLGYPFIVLTILLKASADTGDILYNYVSSSIIGLLLAGLYLLVRKQRDKRK
jgi:hypothetical protein